MFLAVLKHTMAKCLKDKDIIIEVSKTESSNDDDYLSESDGFFEFPSDDAFSKN
jgi:hypothetical protein